MGELKHIVTEGEINRALWNNTGDYADEYNKKLLNTWVAVGAVGDISLTKLRDIQELVHFGGEFIKSPYGTLEPICKGIAGITFEQIVSSLTQDLLDQYQNIQDPGVDGQYSRYAAGTNAIIGIVYLASNGQKIIVNFLKKAADARSFLNKFSSPQIAQKLKGFTPLRATKFYDDFKNIPDDIIMKFDEFPEMVDMWKKLNFKPTKHGVRLDTDLLKKAATTLTPDKQDKLANLFKNQKAPKGKKGLVDETHDFEGVSVYYDKHGFPDFTSHSPGATFNYNPPTSNYVMTGGGSDFTKANDFAKDLPNFQKVGATPDV
jgi:hypothetical protein